MPTIICLLILLGSCVNSSAQNPTATADDPAAPTTATAIDPDLASPRATLTTFLKGIEAAQGSDDVKQWDRVYKTIDLPKSVGEGRRDAAVRLLQILKGVGISVPDPFAPDTTEAAEDRLERFELFPANAYGNAESRLSEILVALGEPPGKIILANDETSGWLFNAETVSAIAPLFGWIEDRLTQPVVDESESRVMDAIRDRMPRWMRRGIFVGMELWQWLGVCLSLLLSVGVYWVVTLLLAPLFAGLSRKGKPRPTAAAVRMATRPAAIAVAALAFMIFLKPLGIIGSTLSALLLAGRLVMLVGISWGAWALTNLITGTWNRHAQKTETTFDDMLVPLVGKTLKLIIIVWAIIYVAASIDVLNFLTPILAGFGLAGLAISFAAQDLIRNVFGGLTVFIDRPFHVGERIALQDYDGVVEQIGFRSTRLRTADGHLVSIPNGVFTSLCVENIGRRPAFRHEIHLALGSDTAATKVETALAAVRSIFEESEIREPINPPAGGVKTPPKVFFDDIAPSAFNITAVYWFGVPDYWEYIEHREKVNFRILKAFEELDIKFATSDQVVHLVSGGTSSPSSTRPMPK